MAILVKSFLRRGLTPFGVRHEPICQRIVYLVRDWIGGKKFSYGGEDGERYIQEKLKFHKSLSESEIKNRQFLERVYEKTSCFLMPHPGDELAELEDGDHTLPIDLELDLKPRFVRAFKGLVEYLFRPHIAEKPKNMFLSGGAWLELFLVNAAYFAEGKILDVMSEKRASAENSNSQILKKYVEEFTEQLGKENCADESKIDDLLAETTESFKSKIEGDEALRKRFLNSLWEKMKDQVRLAVVGSEVKQASIKASHINKCEAALNKAKLLFMSRMEEHSKSFDAVLSRKQFEEAKKEASDLFYMQVEGLHEVRDPYQCELMELFRKRGKILEENIELAEQAKKEAEFRGKKAIHSAYKQYRQLRDQKYENTTYPVPEDEMLQYHREWLEAAKDLYERETNQCNCQHDKNISEIEARCTRLFELTLEHIRAISKQYEERRLNDEEKIKSDVVQEYRDKFREKLLPPSTVINSLFRSSSNRNMTVRLSNSEMEALKKECLEEIEKIYQEIKSRQERYKQEMEAQIKSSTDDYIIDMIRELFMNGEKLKDAHKRVTTTVLNEAVKSCTFEHSPLVERVQEKLNEQYWMMDRLQQKRQDALGEFMQECERHGLSSNGPRAERVIDCVFKKWFAEMPLFPADICNKWVLRGFEASCKAQKPKRSSWFTIGKK